MLKNHVTLKEFKSEAGADCLKASIVDAIQKAVNARKAIEAAANAAARSNGSAFNRELGVLDLKTKDADGDVWYVRVSCVDSGEGFFSTRHYEAEVTNVDRLGARYESRIIEVW